MPGDTIEAGPTATSCWAFPMASLAGAGLVPAAKEAAFEVMEAASLCGPVPCLPAFSEAREAAFEAMGAVSFCGTVPCSPALSSAVLGSVGAAGEGETAGGGTSIAALFGLPLPRFAGGVSLSCCNFSLEEPLGSLTIAVASLDGVGISVSLNLASLESFVEHESFDASGG